MINRPKHLILEAVGPFQYLSAQQLRRLVYGTKVLTHIQQNAADLVKLQLLQPLLLPTLKPTGRPRTFYSLTSAGYKYLGDRSLPDPPKFRDPNDPARNPLFLKHTEASADLLITALILPRADKRFTAPRFKTEAMIKKQRTAVRPDGWIELYTNRPVPIAFEMDRATEARVDWQKKLEAYSDYIRGPYQADFQAEKLTIAVVTTSQRRLAELLVWSKAVLNEINDPVLASILYFASFNPVETSPSQAFLWPIWVSLHENRHQPLLPEAIFGEI